MKLLSVAICGVVLCLAMADYHARQGQDGNINHLMLACKWANHMEHRSLLVDSIFTRIGKTSTAYHRKMIMDAVSIARAGTLQHPRHPLAWQCLTNCLMLQGKTWEAYSSISRAVMLDPLYVDSLSLYKFLHRRLAARQNLTTAR